MCSAVLPQYTYQYGDIHHDMKVYRDMIKHYIDIVFSNYKYWNTTWARVLIIYKHNWSGKLYGYVNVLHLCSIFGKVANINKISYRDICSYRDINFYDIWHKKFLHRGSSSVVSQPWIIFAYKVTICGTKGMLY